MGSECCSMAGTPACDGRDEGPEKEHYSNNYD